MHKKIFRNRTFYLPPLSRYYHLCTTCFLFLFLLLMPAFASGKDAPVSQKPPAQPPEGKITVDKIVIIKSERILQLWYKDHLLKTYPVSLGKDPSGPKQYYGDYRTPEGLYYINGKNPFSKYHKNLGISYPNEKDLHTAKRLGKRPGGQIKIHGLPNNLAYLGKLHLLTNWTKGCIAVTNEEIDELYDIITIGTPVEIRR